MAVHTSVGLIARDQAGARFFVQRKDSAYRRFPRALSFFGGAIEAGESPLAALIRECEEELGAGAGDFVGARARAVYSGMVRYRHDSFHYTLFEIVLSDEDLRALAARPVFEGEGSELLSARELLAEPFVWGLEQVAAWYLRQVEELGEAQESQRREA